MPAHDAYLRRTPFEEILPDPDFPGSAFPAIREEIERHPEAGVDPGAFALLESTRRALAELRDPEAGGEDHGATHALLLFHAFHLHAAGTPHWLVTVPVSRWAVEGEPGTSTGGGLGAASYVQLPQHLFWFRDGPASRPASLDGFFRTLRGGTLHLLGIGGLQGAAGDGFQVIPLPGVPREDAPVWLEETMRDGGEDFRSEMPGAELEGLYELQTAGELLKLAARIDRFAARFGGGADATVPPRDPGGADAGEEGEGPSRTVGPRPSRLAHVRLTL